MKARRIFTPRPPAALHVRERRIYGTSGFLRSVNRRRLKLCARLSPSPRSEGGDSNG
jgi:hypothetical protein